MSPRKEVLIRYGINMHKDSETYIKDYSEKCYLILERMSR